MSHNSNHYATTNQHSHDDERCQGSFVMAVPPSENDSDDDNNPPDHVVEDKLPEEKLNTMALRMAFYCRVMNGFGALALAWATVVLLGGYATLIKPKDFCIEDESLKCLLHRFTCPGRHLYGHLNIISNGGTSSTLKGFAGTTT
uniref:Uncharacterized protein n=1 Tax=Oryza glumipatula TaxID=40148 RepID=A0A0D9YBS5_9ORYZ